MSQIIYGDEGTVISVNESTTNGVPHYQINVGRDFVKLSEGKLCELVDFMQDYLMYTRPKSEQDICPQCRKETL